MKSTKKKKITAGQTNINSVEKFKELYFPLMVEKEKKKEEDQKNYGSAIAMSILDGIRKELNSSAQ
jgi:hypothetical protein